MIYSAVLLFLVAIKGVMGWYPCYPSPLTLAQFVGEPQCTSNLTAFHSYVDIYIPDHPPYDIWKIVGNFEDLSWQASNVTTTGIQNAPNNTHTQVTPAGNATEELNIYAGPATIPPSPTQTLYFMQFRLVQLNELEGVYFDDVEDLIIAVKNGTGTTLSWEISGCTNTSTGATMLYDQLHGHNLNNTVNILNGGQATSPA